MISENEYFNLENKYPVLGSLSSILSQAVHHDLHRIETEEGSVLFDTGESCSAFLMLTSGSIRVIQPSMNGRELLLYRLEPGGTCILTTSCLLGNQDYPARGISETPLTGYLISQGMFNQLVSQSDEFRQFVFSFFAERIASLMTLIKVLTWGQLDRRLALILLKKGKHIKATHQMLADELGTVREVVSRLLKEFEQKGLVQLERKKITIVDQSGLQKIARPFGDLGH